MIEMGSWGGNVRAGLESLVVGSDVEFGGGLVDVDILDAEVKAWMRKVGNGFGREKKRGRIKGKETVEN